MIVHSSDQLRGFWKLGRVKEVLTGRDGKTRGVVLQVAGKGRQATTLYRPVQLSYPLEVAQTLPGTTDGDESGEPSIPSLESTVLKMPRLMSLLHLHHPLEVQGVPH